VIPYFQFPSLHLGPLTIQVFGIFAALGVFVGAKLAMKAAARDRLDPQPIGDYAVWGVASGILSGHLVHLFLYHPEELQGDPLRIFRVWEGLSSFGGLLGAVIAAVIYFRAKRIPIHAGYADAFALGIAPGWGIARLGCFAIHDHPGVLTDFPLAVMFPDGPRHDLGLYDALALFAIAAVAWTLRAKGRMRGNLLAVVALLYGTQRFLTDFLRATDVAYRDARYLGLTPAQYFCFALWAYAAWRLLGHRAASDEARPKKAPRARARA
jgi:phosphatidylglycerol:prolipoprotein diacylglycerol transferase